jgi:hypothetical protein
VNLPPDLQAKILSTPGVLVDGKPVGSEPSGEKPRGQPEREFMEAVIAFARLHGWVCAHFRGTRAQRADGSTFWHTPVQADGAGFPDLLLIKVHPPPAKGKHARLIVVECKAGDNKPTPEQVEWLAAFGAAGIPAYVWRPSDMDLIVEILSGKNLKSLKNKTF